MNFPPLFTWRFFARRVMKLPECKWHGGSWCSTFSRHAVVVSCNLMRFCIYTTAPLFSSAPCRLVIVRVSAVLVSRRVYTYTRRRVFFASAASGKDLCIPYPSSTLKRTEMCNSILCIFYLYTRLGYIMPSRENEIFQLLFNAPVFWEIDDVAN